jgi:signal transduction histidine kinase
MFRLLRYFSLASLAAILVTMVVLVWFYRQIAIDGIAELAERSNMTLARTAMHSMKPMLLDFLSRTEHLQPQSFGRASVPPQLNQAIRTLMQDRNVVRVQIFNRHGVIVFSNRHTQVGSDQRHNAGYKAALSGRVTSSLVYRDSFNSFDGSTEEDNLMQTYVPVRASAADPVRGVFEIYTDVNHLARRTERTELFIMLGALLILASMYASVVLVAWRAGGVIELQQGTIRERTGTLQVLSSHMLKSEESYKKKIALELHEGLAQTLSAIKLHVEHLQRGNSADNPHRPSLEAMLPVLREAIQEVRAIASELRPSSIDDFGLLLTIQRLCRDIEQKHPPLAVDQQIRVEESGIPPHLKIILYRIVASVLDDMALHTRNSRITLGLWRSDGTLTLTIDDTSADALDNTAIPLANIDPELSAGFARMEELATLSGGEFRASRHLGRGTALQASWQV